MNSDQKTIYDEDLSDIYYDSDNSYDDPTGEREEQEEKLLKKKAGISDEVESDDSAVDDSKDDYDDIEWIDDDSYEPPPEDDKEAFRLIKEGDACFNVIETWQWIFNAVHGDNDKDRKKAEELAIELMEKWVKTIISTKFPSYKADRDDLIQEGMISVYTHLKDFDPKKGRASTFFYKNIWHDVNVYTQVYKMGTTRHYADSYALVQKICRELDQKYGKKEHTPVEISIYSKGKLSVSTVKNAIKAMKGNGQYPVDELRTASSTDETNPEAVLLQNELKTNIATAMTDLTPNEIRAITLTYGLSDGNQRTHKMVSKIMETTPDKVKNLVSSGLAKMKRHEKLSSEKAERTMRRSMPQSTYVGAEINITGPNFFDSFDN